MDATKNANPTRAKDIEKQKKRTRFKRDLKRYIPLYIAFAPILVYYIVMRYMPIFLQFPLALTKFRLADGIWGSAWVGLSNFTRLFASYDFRGVLFNTLRLFGLSLLVGFLPPIFLAIMLHDMQSRKIARVCQTVLYVPHFFSWIIVYGIAWALFATGAGAINSLFRYFGMPPVDFLTNPNTFLPLILGTALWKGIGWGTIIYLASLSSIDHALYEAAIIDGAGPLQRIRHVTFPQLKPIMVFVLTMNMGGVLNAGGEQVLVFLTPATYSVGDVLTTWIYQRGVVRTDFSFATAAGLFQSVIGLILVLTCNKLAKRYAGVGMW